MLENKIISIFKKIKYHVFALGKEHYHGGKVGGIATA